MTANAKTKKAVTYLQMITRDEKKLKQEQAIYKAQEAKLKTDSEILKLTSELSVAKNKLAVAQSRVPYSASVEFEVTKEIMELEERLEFFKAIQSERFTDVSI